MGLAKVCKLARCPQRTPQTIGPGARLLRKDHHEDERAVKIVKAAYWPDVTSRGPWSRFVIGGAPIDWLGCLPRYGDPETVLPSLSMTGSRQAFLLCYLMLFMNSRLVVDP